MIDGKDAYSFSQDPAYGVDALDEISVGFGVTDVAHGVFGLFSAACHGTYHCITAAPSQVAKKVGQAGGYFFLPGSGYYQEKIKVESERLSQLSNSPHPERLCQLAAPKIREQIKNNVDRNLIQGAMQDNDAIMDEMIEYNMLIICTRIYEKIEAIEKENPYFFADLVQEIMQETTKELYDIRTGEVHVQEVDSDRLYKDISKALLRIAFPEGKESIAIPESFFQGRIQEQVYAYIEQKALPRGIEKMFLTLEKPSTRDTVCFFFYDRINTILKKGSSGFLQQFFTKELPKEPYQNQAKFNQAFSDFSMELIAFVDPKKHALLKKIGFGRLLQRQGPKVSQKLACFDAKQVLNFSCKKGVEKLENRAIPDTGVPDTRSRDLQAIYDEFGTDFSGFIEQRASKAVKHHAEKVGDVPKKKKEKIRRAYYEVVRVIKKKSMQFATKVYAGQYVHKKGKETERKIKELNLPELNVAFKVFVSKKV